MLSYINNMQYELSYILKSDIEETKVKEVTEDLVNFVSEIGETPLDSKHLTGQEPKITIQPKILELAYPIKKQTQGFWGALEFDIEAKRLSELEKKLKDTKEIIRFMLTKRVVEKKEKKEKKKEKIVAPPKTTPPPTKEGLELEKKRKSLPPKAKKEEKAEIKDLDKKLDEILKEV